MRGRGLKSTAPFSFFADDAAALVTLSGPYLSSHKEETLNTMKQEEAKHRDKTPIGHIMEIRDEEGRNRHYHGWQIGPETRARGVQITEGRAPLSMEPRPAHGQGGMDAVRSSPRRLKEKGPLAECGRRAFLQPNK